MMQIPAKPIQVFYSYAHKDEIFRRELEKHLSNLRQQGFIQEWHDRMIVAGTDWAFDIDTHLNSASLILLLISPDFMESDYCLSIEMTRAMELHKAGEAYVVPILLRPVDWEGAPFARLQVLPSGARPITVWEDLDQAFLNVSRGIRQVIERLRSGDFARFADVSQDITRLPGEQTSDFMSLENYLKPSRHRSPSGDDFEHDLIYVSEKQRVELIRMLHEKRRVLLTGSQAAGKTVLAIALAKQLQEHDNYKVAYKDVEKAREGEGRRWYQLMRGHDRKGVLYLLDNCHLAPEEVNEFCQQWEEQPPEYTQCLLISRAHAGEEEVSWATYHYFEACGDAIMQTRSEEVYWGMLEKYATYYQQQHPGRYASFTEDEIKLLKRQHAHNLVVSKSRLEAWSELGGRLSDVKQEAVYTAMIKRYCSRWKEALPKLCALRQYEIRAHNFFVESHLPRQEVQQLQEERLLTGATAQNYGMLYDLAFHPAEARELFEAYIYYRYGRVTGKHLRNSTLEALRAYLETSPLNYMEVYERLAQQKQKRMLERLLKDPDLQECAARQFETGNLIDAIRYLFRLAKIDALRAHALLARLIEDIGIRDLCARIVDHPFQEVALLLQNLQQIDGEIAKQVVAMLNLELCIKHIEEQNIQSFLQLVQVLNVILPAQGRVLLVSVPGETLLVHITARNFHSLIEQLREMGYPPAQLKQVVELLHVDVLIEQYERTQRTNLAHFYKMVHTCKSIAPAKARMILETMPPELLAQRALASNLNLVCQVVDIMHELEVPQTSIEHFLQLIGVEWLVQKAEKENLQHLFWILRSFQRVSSMMANQLLEALSPAGLAALCCTKEASIEMVGQFNKVSPKLFWQQFLRQFTPEDMVAIFNRSSLGVVGRFLLPRYFYFRQSYQLFYDCFLKVHFQTESLEEIGMFLACIQQISEVGNDLVYNAVSLLAEVDIVERVASADLEQFALLLYHSKDVPTTYLFQLLRPLQQPDVMRVALEQSKLNSIQRLIHNVAGIDRTLEKRYLQALERGLRNADLRKSINNADLAVQTQFLANVSRYIDPELAQIYRWFIDGSEGTL
jgi:TIR domain